MSYKTAKEELIVTILRKFAIPLNFNITSARALELALESKEVEEAEKVGIIKEGSVKRALKKLENGEGIGDALNELGLFSEYDIQVLDMAAKHHPIDGTVEKLIDFYAVTYHV